MRIGLSYGKHPSIIVIQQMTKVDWNKDLAHAKAQVMFKDPSEDKPCAAKESKPETKKEPAECTLLISKETQTSETLQPTTENSEQAPSIPTRDGSRAVSPERGSADKTDEGEGSTPKEEPIEDSKEEENKEEKPDEAWGAVCVVGLRVYCKDADATIQIIRPKKESALVSATLDVDDPAKDATAADGGKRKEEKEADSGDHAIGDAKHSPARVVDEVATASK